MVFPIIDKHGWSVFWSYFLPSGLPDFVYPCQLKSIFIRRPSSQTLSSDEPVPGNVGYSRITNANILSAR